MMDVRKSGCICINQSATHPPYLNIDHILATTDQILITFETTFKDAQNKDDIPWGKTSTFLDWNISVPNHLSDLTYILNFG